jgi:hypothetical protein
LGISVTNQNYCNEKFSSRLTSGTGCGTQLRTVILSTATDIFPAVFREHKTFVSKGICNTQVEKKLQMWGFENCMLIKRFWKIKSIGYDGPSMFYVQA